MQTNDYSQFFKVKFKKKCNEYWKDSYGYNQTFGNESNFDLK